MFCRRQELGVETGTPLSRRADVGGNDGLAALPMRGLKAGRIMAFGSVETISALPSLRRERT